MAAAAGEHPSFDSALAATLQDLKLTFSLRKEQRTALKSFLEKKYVFRVLINYVVRAVALTTSPSSLLWLVVALSYCVQRELERQPFIPPTLPMEWVWLARAQFPDNDGSTLVQSFLRIIFRTIVIFFLAFPETECACTDLTTDRSFVPVHWHSAEIHIIPWSGWILDSVWLEGVG